MSEMKEICIEISQPLSDISNPWLRILLVKKQTQNSNCNTTTIIVICWYISHIFPEPILEGRNK